MRLTLRTLLAYMDDVLDPEHAREIGNKVNASGNATALVNRIREVTRRRRLLAPDLVGPEMGLDPNTVAEYLDSTLEADGVADVEKVCLDSDMHLAEVAACHQVLTIVLGEPVDVPTRTRERMYALGSSRSRPTLSTDVAPDSQAVGMTTPTPDPERAPVKSVTMTPAKPANDEFPDGIPDYLKPAPFWKRVFPIAIGVVLVGGWAIMMYRELLGRGPATEVASQSSDRSRPSSQRDDPTQANPAGVTVNEAGQPINDNNDDQRFRRGSKNDPNVVVPMNAPGDAVAVVTPRPVPMPESVIPKNPASVDPPENKTPQPMPAVKPEVPTTNPPTPNPAEIVKPDLDASLPGPEFLYVSRNGRLVHRGASGWSVMPYRSTIRRGDRVCAPYPFSAQFEVAELGLSIELLPGSCLEFAGATPKEALRLDLLRGRIAIKRTAPDNADTLTMGLRLLGEPCEVSIVTPQALFGIEVVPREPNSFEMELGEDRLHGTVSVVTGEVHFIGSVAGDDKLGPQSWYSLAVRDRRQPDPARRQTQLVVMPDWLDANKARMTATERTYATQFEKKFDADLPLAETMSSLLNEKSQVLSTWAARALAVTESPADLVKAMARAEFEETRLAAIIGLRQWLVQSPKHRDLLREELGKNFATEHVDAIYRLLWGYNDDDARSAPTSRLLVDWLRHDNVVIRHLAFHHLQLLTGQRYDFRPMSPATARSAAIERWNMHLERNKGQLVP